MSSSLSSPSETIKPKKKLSTTTKIIIAGGGAVLLIAVVAIIIVFVSKSATSSSSSSSNSTSTSSSSGPTHATFTNNGSFAIQSVATSGYLTLCNVCAIELPLPGNNCPNSLSCNTSNTYTGGTTQQFTFISQGDGSYQITINGNYVFYCDGCQESTSNSVPAYNVCASSSITPTNFAQWFFIPVSGQTNQYYIQNAGNTSIYMNACLGCFTNGLGTSGTAYAVSGVQQTSPDTVFQITTIA
jgi:hypothetical protein